MSATQAQFLFSRENFLIVARELFPAGVLRDLRSSIAKRRAALRMDDERSRKAEEVGVAPDALRLNEEWYEIWKHAEIETFRRHVPEFTEVIFPPQIRTVRETRAMVPWHQDATYMEALGKRGHSEVITCFVPLDDDAENRPTLQFCIDPEQRALRAVRRDTEFNQFDIADEDRPAQEKCCTFPLKLGDAFVFGKHVLHRTYAAAEAFPERNSMEFRLTTERARLPGKDYFSLNRMRFYRTVP